MVTQVSKEDQEARLAAAKAKAAKGTRSKFGKPVSGDQKDGSGEPKKAKKKPSEQVVRWRDTENPDTKAKITISAEAAKVNPKKRGAATRFSIYKTGMTVADYIEASKKAGNSGALAMADVRWDMAAGFISVK